jgi:methylisocitrate lyase
MIFAEALKSLAEYREFAARIPVPVLANLTEFGQTPLFTVEELRATGVRLILYPLSAFRAAARAQALTYAAIRAEGTQKRVLDAMQTRAELYEVLGYHDYEKKLDELFGKAP